MSMQGVAASVSDTLGNIKPWLQKVTAQTKPTDGAKYFGTNKKGEIFELKAELNSGNGAKKKEAVKKVIASMTVGKDVSSLFPDVVNCMQTDVLELKKLVYLYLMNYAKSQPDTAILAVNTFVRDCEDSNPLIRALAVRTMGCIRVDRITTYLCDPLRKCLKDEDPYVRKTAAVCVAKLYDIDSSVVEESGFLEALKELLSDSNPMVVANAVAAISEILETCVSEQAHQLLALNPQVVGKLLTALNECTEWGQVFVLDAIATYVPATDSEAQSICERVTPRLAHANAAVVLSAVKVIMKLLEQMSHSSGATTEPAGPNNADPNFAADMSKKLAPPLVTLLSAEPEIQYVALRNINLIVQKRIEVLRSEMKVFFVKYNDPIYVKLEKLDIMIRLTNHSNISQVLAELKEYAKEVDVDFVRKSVRAIGRCAIKVEGHAEKCVNTLQDLIRTRVNYVVQEAIVVIKDIFRKYPNRYEGTIATLCDNLDTLDEPEARAAMIWIIGEYANRIDNAEDLLESFLEGFADENPAVQLQLLTAIVKLYLKRKDQQTSPELVQNVLQLATQHSDNPDLRDRGFIYWRLLSTDPEIATKVVLAEKPLISEETDLLEPTLLDELICHLASLASVYHRPPAAFIEGSNLRRQQAAAMARRLQTGGAAPSAEEAAGVAAAVDGTVVIPHRDMMGGENLLLDLDPEPSGAHGGGTNAGRMGMSATPEHDVLGLDGLDLLGVGGGTGHSSHEPVQSSSSQQDVMAILGGLSLGPVGQSSSGFDILAGPASSTVNTVASGYSPPRQIWLPHESNKGLEIAGTFMRVGSTSQIYMELVFTNRALGPMSDFAIQFNKNSFGLVPTQPLQVPSPLAAGQSHRTLLPLEAGGGPTAKMNPLMLLQVAVKNNVQVFYFTATVPINVLFVQADMEKKVFLSTWKDIPGENEHQIPLLEGVTGTVTAAQASQALAANNVVTVAQRSIEGADMLYQTMKCTNGIWVLAELKIQSDTNQYMLSLKARTVEVYEPIGEVYEAILRSIVPASLI